jgi:hypothetical protein
MVPSGRRARLAVWEDTLAQHRIKPVETQAFGDLKAQHQQALCSFIETDLELGRNLVDSGKAMEDESARERSKENATKAAENVRNFLDRVEDAEVRSQMAKRLAALEESISAL